MSNVSAHESDENVSPNSKPFDRSMPVHSFDIEDPFGDYGQHPADDKNDRISLPADFSIVP